MKSGGPEGGILPGARRIFRIQNALRYALQTTPVLHRPGLGVKQMRKMKIIADHTADNV
jgi:hypothetical protein